MKNKFTENDNLNTTKESSWFAKDGNYDDIVISTRVRISRNLADFLFPDKLTFEEKERVKTLIYDAFNSNPDYYFIETKDIAQNGIQLLKDKNIIKNAQMDAIVLDTKDESYSCLVNESDHIKIAAFSSGLETENTMQKVYKIDEFLQEKLQFAASFDFGYLTSAIKDCGSGMKISFRIFIPSIVLSGQFDSVAALIAEHKLKLRPNFPTEETGDFSNFLFDLSSSNSFEGNEFDQMANIRSVVTIILKTERKIRKEFADNNPTVVLNFFKQRVARALYSLLLTYEEGVSIIGAVKWGLQMGLVNGLTESELNALFFRTKNGHLKYLCDNFAFTFEDDIKSSENLQLKRLRTIVIQSALEGIVNEESVS